MDIFTALAVPTRRDIIELLATRGQLSATDICSKFSSSPPAISQHLKVLLEVKLVKVNKKRQQRIYQLDQRGLQEFQTWSQKMTSLWNQRFDALDQLLETEKKITN